MADENELLEFAEEVAKNAGDFLLKQWQTPFKVYESGKWDLYTQADIDNQQKIVEKIHSKYPNHGFLAEEPSSNLPANRHITWIIDPIDGSINYSRHQPLFAISIAVAIGTTLRVGVIYDPCRDEMFSAAQGLGFRLNGQKRIVKWRDRLEKSTIAFDWGRSEETRENTHHALTRVRNKVFAMNTLGSASLSLAWIADGRLDGYFSYELDSWDIAAGYVMLSESGGRIIGWNGEPWNWRSNKIGCFAGGPFFCQRIRDILI